MLAIRTEDNKVFKQISTPAFEDRVIADGGTVSSVDNTDKILDAVAAIGVQPSVVMVPSGIKASKLYSQIPYGGTADFTVTRSGTTGMRLNNGYWQPVAADTPRVDLTWDEATQMFIEWLEVEEARTNLIARYKSFAHSDWTKSGASIQGDPNTAGVELITNAADREFSSDTGFWTKGTGCSINDGVCTLNNPSGLSSLIRNSFYTIGKLYLLELEIKSISGTLNVANLGSSRAFTTTGIKKVFGTSEYAGISIYSSTGSIVIIDNVSIKEVTGYASPFVDASGANLMSGYKLVEDTSNGSHRVYRTEASADGTTNAYTVFAKYSGRRLGFLGGGSSSTDLTIFDLETGTVVSKGSNHITATITQYAAGWYKCSVTATNLLKHIYLYSVSGTSISYLGDGTSGILIAHAQLEAGATASSPIGGAEGSSQTRNTDVIVKTGASALIGQTEGTITLYCLFTGDSARDIVRFYNQEGTNTDFIAIGINATKQISARLRYNDGTNRNIDLINTTAISVNTSYKITLKYKSGNTKLYVNDIEVASSTTVFAFSTILYGYIYSTQYVYGLGSFNLGYMYLTKSI